MKINKDVVEYVAHLGRLKLEPVEIDLYTSQLDRILEHMDRLNSLNTEGIEPTSRAVPVTCVPREDVKKDSITIEDSVMNAPDRKGNFFKVPPVIEVD
ncbi:MAG: Asp-tRNA(Asn)/Glu-tRNA(Gln) amidotransferase subunit GatC [Syntrophobacterales bacterium]|jgi:aspartyl-tRNA(Asn)/glutamyl-tRNA(Gln) amidotransferase subunit C|nr:Asp-tRNA(Asn)/Glu-tRNA(Gln) amidotransferase subunit GatC [Syntrophobacterales bacterium]